MPFNNKIDASTRYCAVYGFPIHHSASPAMQNAGLSALGLNWRYLACEVHPSQLKQAILGAQAMRFAGLNLTVPHKILALDMMDVLDDSAKILGAVNTVRFEARNELGEWQPIQTLAPASEAPLRAHGFNTDGNAVIRSIQQDLELELQGSKVILLGVGGAGKTAALKLASSGVSELHLINRTTSKAVELKEKIETSGSRTRIGLDYPKGKVDLIVNATSLGLTEEDPLPLDLNRFPLSQANAVYDMIYQPPMTRLLKEANREGCRTANGATMLLLQGVEAMEIWTGEEAPIEIMKQSLERHLQHV
ncbi:MAG TPA: shikimate dehydrogenase [Verrucomicrobiales bacterium]|nr:shikimate dehydrogenase [Verrucomicrobiales bacterium]HIL70241.1 shikimate dehydrogenase [Verrucomicrobiota bacterium]